MKAKEIKDLTIEDIREKLTDKSAELAKLKMNHAISPVENPLSIRHARKTIARLKTELNKKTKEAANSNSK